MPTLLPTPSDALMGAKPLSQSITEVAGIVEAVAIAEGYADASNLLRPLMRDIPDGHIAVGAMDGWTAVVPRPVIKARPTDVRFDDVVQAVMADTTETRAYLADLGR